MQEERLSSGPLRFNDPRREAMLEPEEVSAILRLNELGWGAKRIARELGISRKHCEGFIEAGGWTYRQPQCKKALESYRLKQKRRSGLRQKPAAGRNKVREKRLSAARRTASRSPRRHGWRARSRGLLPHIGKHAGQFPLMPWGGPCPPPPPPESSSVLPLTGGGLITVPVGAGGGGGGSDATAKGRIDSGQVS